MLPKKSMKACFRFECISNSAMIGIPRISTAEVNGTVGKKGKPVIVSEVKINIQIELK
jgi:hypothetical protein